MSTDACNAAIAGLNGKKFGKKCKLCVEYKKTPPSADVPGPSHLTHLEQGAR